LYRCITTNGSNACHALPMLCQTAGPMHKFLQPSFSLLMSTPTINQTISLSCHRSFACITPISDASVQGNLWRSRWFPLPFSATALVGLYETRAAVGWSILECPGSNRAMKFLAGIAFVLLYIYIS